MTEPTSKKVDESWKEQVEREKHQPVSPAAGSPPPRESAEPEAGLPEARFDVFISGLAVDALMAMGDMPHPVTKKTSVNLPHARYLIDLLGVMEEKTRGNLAVDEERMLKDTLYQLRMRYLAKSGSG